MYNEILLVRETVLWRTILFYITADFRTPLQVYVDIFVRLGVTDLNDFGYRFNSLIFTVDRSNYCLVRSLIVGTDSDRLT